MGLYCIWQVAGSRWVVQSVQVCLSHSALALHLPKSLPSVNPFSQLVLLQEHKSVTPKRDKAEVCPSPGFRSSTQLKEIATDYLILPETEVMNKNSSNPDSNQNRQVEIGFGTVRETCLYVASILQQQAGERYKKGCLTLKTCVYLQILTCWTSYSWKHLESGLKQCYQPFVRVANYHLSFSLLYHINNTVFLNSNFTKSHIFLQIEAVEILNLIKVNKLLRQNMCQNLSDSTTHIDLRKISLVTTFVSLC